MPKTIVIKGPVTRVVSDTNFFIRPTEPDEATMRFINLDGHHAGTDEISAEKINGPMRFKRYSSDLPKIGDVVELELVTPYGEDD
jgi:hypothetical protein